MRFADPKNDLAFKKIFGNSKHKNILISFLNSVLDFKDGKEIVEIELANPYQVPKIPELKEEFLDSFEIAKNSISQGLDNATISLVTGLNVDMIESLRD